MAFFERMEGADPRVLTYSMKRILSYADRPDKSCLFPFSFFSAIQVLSGAVRETPVGSWTGDSGYAGTHFDQRGGKMRKKEKEITAHGEIESIIGKSLVFRVAFSEKNRPYIVPLCFGYKDHTLYFHCAPEGRKMEILRKNNQVCFEFDVDQELVKDDQACKFDMK